MCYTIAYAVCQDLYIATEERLPNNSILATLTVTGVSESTEGTYKLMASNAGGQIEQPFDLVPPAPHTGMSSGQVAGVVIGVLILVSVLAAAGYMYYRHNRQQVPYREMDRTAEAPFTQPTAIASAPPEATGSLSVAPKSYGATDNPFATTPEGDPKIV